MSVYPAIASSACGCDDGELVAPLVSVSEALAAGLKLVRPLQDGETVELHRARGRVLARPVLALADMPGFDNSGMDGFAVCADGLKPGSGLPVRGVSAAGAAVEKLSPGTAMRIFTGAPVPRGADAVIPQEMTERHGDRIILTRTPGPGENIRRQGEDMHRSDRVLEAGCLLDARTIAACAGAGVGQVSVRPALRVALVLTGQGNRIWPIQRLTD